MTTPDEYHITQAVLEFLKTADMSVTTERIVLQHVQNTLQLDRPVQEYKRLVSDTIDKYLETLDAEVGTDGEEGHGEEEPHEDDDEVGGTGRKRTGRGVKPVAKRARGSGSGGGEEVLLNVDLSSRRKARVRRWEGKLYVDVREFYQKDGVDAPTQKGLSMDPGQWARLARDLPHLVAAQRTQDVGAPAAQLSKTRVASVSEFKGTFYLGLREFYEKDGQLAPTKKGVNLNLAEAEALLAASADITAAAGGMAGPPPLPEDAGPAAAAPKAAAVIGGATGGPAAGGGESAAAGAEAREVVELGGKKRLSISRFGGRLSVDLREFYDKNGELLPGKKGIALSPADWATLCGNLRDITNALERRDMSYVLQLSGMRRVSLSEFKGVHYVGVREFYDKGGELAPGAKGLSMNAEQWRAVVGGAPAITAALKQAQGH